MWTPKNKEIGIRTQPSPNSVYMSAEDGGGR